MDEVEPQATNMEKAKRLCKEYGLSKDRIAYIETRHRRILDYAKVNTDQITKEGVIHVDERRLACFCKRDQEIVRTYQHAKEVVLYIDKAIAAIPESPYKGMLMEGILNGNRPENIMQKYSVSKATYFREKQKMMRLIAEKLYAS
jgi:hypothetical protein